MLNTIVWGEGGREEVFNNAVTSQGGRREGGGAAWRPSRWWARTPLKCSLETLGIYVPVSCIKIGKCSASEWFSAGTLPLVGLNPPPDFPTCRSIYEDWAAQRPITSARGSIPCTPFLSREQSKGRLICRAHTQIYTHLGCPFEVGIASA